MRSPLAHIVLGFVASLSVIAGRPCIGHELFELEPERQFPRHKKMAADDLDHDGIPDAKEQSLAERFAPVVYHRSDEPNKPCSVDWMLRYTRLKFHDNYCGVHIPVYPSQGVGLTQEKLHWAISGTCGLNDRFDSYGWADSGNLSPPLNCISEKIGSLLNRSKERTFYLTDVPEKYREGSRDTRDWTTYVHVYPNSIGGKTIQYWRCYSFNAVVTLGISDIGSHGGDWEGCQIALDGSDNLARAWVMNDDHKLQDVTGELEWESGHPRVFVEQGKHGTLAHSEGVEHEHGYRQQTWTGGRVWWPDGHDSPGGKLLNVGEKLACLNDQYFIAYSGLWGSPGSFTFTGGYWGPAFNDTSLGKDGFVHAWAHDMKVVTEEECYPCHIRWELTGDGESWQVDKPNVRRPRTTYSLVRFLPGDIITITAGGCVQSGGSGDTWKNYLHPDPSDMYFGQIDLPGITNGQEPLSQYINRQLFVDGELPISLTLGYSDDDYPDNGYWGHKGDNGTEDQCENVGDAFVAVKVVRPAPAPDVFKGEAAEIWTAIASSDRRTFYTGGGHMGAFGEIKVWDILERCVVSTFPRTGSLVMSLALSDDGIYLASGEADGTLSVWDTRTSKTIWTSAAHVKPVTALTFQRAPGQMIVSASEDRDVKAWRVGAAGNPLWTKRGLGPQFSLRGFPDGVRLFSGGRGLLIDSSDIVVRAFSSGDAQTTFGGHKLPVTCAALSANGSLLVTADGSLKSDSVPATARVWDIASGTEKFVLNGHDGPIYSVGTMEYHGHQILATGSADKSARLWDLATGEEVAVVHTNAVAAAVSFDAMSRLLIVADSTRLAEKPRGNVAVWELRRLIARIIE